ncbi:MAG: glutathione-dependent reductase [Rhodobacteraceae bacterium]|nr:glutathione S-transferase C-terminal domain-containing protein [Alphaproteobacteria bacterium]NNK66818.1 glutathione-dependent reductase [Paracoccaceae bacterium]
MGLMIEGTYHAEDPGPDTQLDGEFQRQRATIRNWITADGPFTPDAVRYHLYAAWNCPWAHRVLLVLALKNLPITVSYARPRRTADGWIYDAEGPFADALMGVASLHEVYARARPAYTGRITVPLLWDRETDSAVSNESADIVRMLARQFPGGPELCPPDLEEEIDRWNALIYARVNNGVYRAGFARTQEAYDTGVTALFETLDEIEARLATARYLCGDRFTEADLRLFPTLARFDVAYHYAFKCNIRRIQDYPHLWGCAREIYAMPGVAGTVTPEIYKQGYFSKSPLRNPLGIVPAGPVVDWSGPHERHLIG